MQNYEFFSYYKALIFYFVTLGIIMEFMITSQTFKIVEYGY